MRKKKRIVAITIISIAITGGSLAMLLNIKDKKEQSKYSYFQVVQLNDEIDDPEIWGKNFPDQYADYLKTTDQVRTKYGGSEAIPRNPSASDPRNVTSQSKLDEDPRLIDLWAGYAFSKDFREERGHAYMLVDQQFTERQTVVKQPGTCINCHASTYVAMKKLGNGNLAAGFDQINRMPYHEAQTHTKHPIACIDCHNPADMSLRISKPAFMEGIAVYKLQHDGIKSYDVNKMASPQEKRVYVCAQCHVEYYFKGEGKRLTFPWNNGLKADEILEYYETINHKDWIHKFTDAPVLKAQHPEFEMYSQGIHARSGVSCVDCHMPYKRIGAKKITDHHVRSPVLNIQKSCQTCHRWGEDEIVGRISQIQDRHTEIRNITLNALIDLIKEIQEKKLRLSKQAPQKLLEAQKYQRKAQFLFDFVEAENSSGFHAPQEAMRIFSKSLDYSRKGQNAMK